MSIMVLIQPAVGRLTQYFLRALTKTESTVSISTAVTLTLIFHLPSSLSLESIYPVLIRRLERLEDTAPMQRHILTLISG